MIQKILNLSILDEMGEGQISFQEGVDMTYCPTYYDLTNNGVIVDVRPIDVFQYSIIDGKTSYSNYQLVSGNDVQIASLSWIDVVYNVTSTSTPLTLFTTAHTPTTLEIDGVKIEEPTSAYTFSTTGSHTVRSYYDASKTNFTQGVIGTPASATTIDVSNLKTKSATSFNGFFYNCQLITEIDGLGELNTSNVTSLQNTFQGCSNLTSLEGLEKWNTTNVTNLDSTFRLCSKLGNAKEIENWNTSKVTTMNSMFGACKSLQEFSFSNLDVSNVTVLSNIFWQCPSMANLNGLENFKNSKLTSVDGFFNNSTRTGSKITSLENMEDWDVSRCTNFYGVYKTDAGGTACHIINLSGWTPSDTVSYTSGCMFYGVSPLEVYLNNFINKAYNGYASYSFDFYYATALIHADNWSFKTNDEGELDMPKGLYSYNSILHITSYRRNAKLTKAFMLLSAKIPQTINILILDPVAIENVAYPSEVASTVTSVTINYDGVEYENDYHMSRDFKTVLTTKNEEKSRTPLTVTFEIGENYTTEPITFTETITFEDATYTLSFVQSPIGQEELTVFTNIDDEEQSVFIEGEMTTSVIPYSEYNLKSCAIGIRVTSLCTALFANSAIESVTIPNSITNIDGGVFYSCQSLTSVTIPNSVTNIGDMVFMNCISLENIHIGNSVVNIGNGAFLACESLTSVTIPNSVKTIDNEAFKGCTSLTSVTIGNSVTSIGNYAFNNCTSLINITFEGTIEEWNSITKGLYWGLNVLASEVICSNGSCPIDSEIA